MAKQSSIESRTEALLQLILEELQFELVDVEYVKEGSDWYLRAYIDKEGGISVDDCETVSRSLEKKLDEEDLIENAYILEVSSPGLTRALKKPVDGAKEFIGDLLRYDQDSVVLDIGPEEPEEIVIPRSNIAIIKQYFSF